MADANENDNGDGSSGLGGWGGVADGNIAGGNFAPGPTPDSIAIGAMTAKAAAELGLTSSDGTGTSFNFSQALRNAGTFALGLLGVMSPSPQGKVGGAMQLGNFASAPSAFSKGSGMISFGSAPPSLFGGNASIGRSLSDGFSGGEVNEAGRIDSSPVLGFNGVTANRPGVTTKPAPPGRSYSLALAGPAGQPSRYGASPAAGPDNSAGLVLAGLAALLTFN